MEEQSKEDKLTQTRRSFQQVSLWRRFYGIVCPCFSFGKKQNQVHEVFHGGHEETKSSIKDERNVTAFFDGIDMKKNSIQTDSTVNRHKQRKTSLYVSNLNRKRVLNIQPSRDYLIKSTVQKWHSYPIYQYYKEKQIVAIGFKNKKLLALISSRRPLPTKIAESKTKRSASYMDDYIQDENSASNVDKFWARRYYLFQKFDEGISMDEQSWGTVVPEAVAEYIASKVRCDTVLDAFCGVGGISLKLANTCYRVIANDFDNQKIKCLKRNASVYSVDNIQTKNNDFLELNNLTPDIVVIHPEIHVMNWQNRNHTKPEDLSPNFQLVIEKAIKMSNNFVLLLPANIDPNLLTTSIVQAYMKSKINASTCSIKIQKIFFLSKMAYLAVYMGSQVQSQVKLNDELSYIYSLLKDDKTKVFKDKRVVKAIRQKYGMINLLNFVFESQDLDEGTPIQKFYQFVRDRKLLDQKRLQKIIEEEEKERTAKKIPLIDPTDEEDEEQKYVQDQSNERTVSYYSINSPNRISCVSANRISAQPRSFRSTGSNVLQGCLIQSNISDNQDGLKIKETSSDYEQKSKKEGGCSPDIIEEQIVNQAMTRSAFNERPKEEDK